MTEFRSRGFHERVHPDDEDGTVITKQSFKESADINYIYQRGLVGGLVPFRPGAMYMDLPGPIDYQESLNAVMEAQRAFDALPAKVRNRFENDPVKLLAFLQDEANRDEAIELGLLEPAAPAERPQPEPTPLEEAIAEAE